MKVKVRATGEILDVEYDDDDLYKGFSAIAKRPIWLYYNEFDELPEEETV